jgi:hypothetical protein
MAGVDAIHEALKVKYEWAEPNLAVFNTCPTVKRNFLRFVWDDYRSSKDRDIKGPRQEVRKTDDDFIAAIRYIYQSGITYAMLARELQNKPDPEEIDKNYGINMMTGAPSGRRTRGERIGSLLTYS